MQEVWVKIVFDFRDTIVIRVVNAVVLLKLLLRPIPIPDGAGTIEKHALSFEDYDHRRRPIIVNGQVRKTKVVRRFLSNVPFWGTPPGPKLPRSVNVR